MTSLTEQCLASINRIDTLYGESDQSITKTIAELCDKCDIMFNLSNNEIVLENWWEQKPDESKLVTFFLFIPRLFRQIIQYLKDIFEKIRYKLMNPVQKELWDMLKTPEVERFNKYMNDPDHIRAIADDNGNIEINYCTRLRSATNVMKYLDESRDIFQRMGDIQRDRWMQTNEFSMVSVELLGKNTSEFSEMILPAPTWISERELFVDQFGYNPDDRDAFRNYLNQLSSKIDSVKKEVDAILKQAGEMHGAQVGLTGSPMNVSTHNDINFMQIQERFKEMQKNFIELGKEVDYLYGLNRKKIYALEKLDEDLIKTSLIADGKLKVF